MNGNRSKAEARPVPALVPGSRPTRSLNQFSKKLIKLGLQTNNSLNGYFHLSHNMSSIITEIVLYVFQGNFKAPAV